MKWKDKILYPLSQHTIWHQLSGLFRYPVQLIASALFLGVIMTGWGFANSIVCEPLTQTTFKNDLKIVEQPVSKLNFSYFLFW